jgi:sarcosine oxidase subunit alpha
MNQKAAQQTGAAQEAAFRFEGKPLKGIRGEPIAKALFRAGIKILSHGPKYHRPRSIHCARGRCSMCNMEVDGVPGVPVCVTPLEDGMNVNREDFRPLYAPLLTQALRSVSLPAGFYYRMFTRPAFLKNMFMKRVRAMAGTGRITLEPPEKLRKAPRGALEGVRNSYDVVVVGAGLSGMSASLSAGRQGRRVLLVDEYARAGGHSLGFHADGDIAAERDRLIETLENSAAITCCFQTTAHGFYPPDTLLLGNHCGMKRVRARTFIFATGAYDVIPLFEGNDIPGVFGERAVRLLLERDGLAAGTRAVVYGSHPHAGGLAALMQARGIEIAGIADAERGLNPEDRPAAHAGSARGLTLTKAGGRSWITGASFTSEGRVSRDIHLPCDMLAVAFRGQPAYELPHQAGFSFELSNDPVEGNRVLLPTAATLSASGVSFLLAGQATGERDWRARIEQGRSAGARLETDHSHEDERKS